MLVPARLAADRMTVIALAGASDSLRVAQRLAAADAAPALAFAPMPTMIVGRSGFTWDGPHDSVTLSATQGGAGGGFRSFQLISSAWQVAAGAVRAPWIDPGELPGWDPAWPRFTSGVATSYDAGVSDGANDGDLTAAVRFCMFTW